MRETPLEASIAQALEDAARRDDRVVAADAIEFTGRTPLVGLDLRISEE